jgi:hypothetical protein
MDEYIMGSVTDIEVRNEDGTLYNAVINGLLCQCIRAGKGGYGELLQKAIAAGEPVKPYIAPPVPDPKIAALEASDMALLKAGARSFEDLMAERIAEGKFVAQKVKDIISMRVNLRK